MQATDEKLRIGCFIIRSLIRINRSISSVCIYEVSKQETCAHSMQDKT